MEINLETKQKFEQDRKKIIGHAHPKKMDLREGLRNEQRQLYKKLVCIALRLVKTSGLYVFCWFIVNIVIPEPFL